MDVVQSCSAKLYQVCVCMRVCGVGGFNQNSGLCQAVLQAEDTKNTPYKAHALMVSFMPLLVSRYVCVCVCVCVFKSVLRLLSYGVDTIYIKTPY